MPRDTEKGDHPIPKIPPVPRIPPIKDINKQKALAKALRRRKNAV